MSLPFLPTIEGLWEKLEQKANSFFNKEQSGVLRFPISKETIQEQAAKQEEFNKAKGPLAKIPDIIKGLIPSATDIQLIGRGERIPESLKEEQRQAAMNVGLGLAGIAPEKKIGEKVIKEIGEKAGPVISGTAHIIEEAIDPILKTVSNFPQILSSKARKIGLAALNEIPDEISGKLIKKYGETVAGQIAETGGKDFSLHALVNGTEEEVGKVLSLDKERMAVTKAMDFIREVGKPKAQTEAMRSFERAGRAGEVGTILEKGEGKEAFIAAKGSLKGELSRAEFAPSAAITEEETKTLFDIVRTSNLQPFQKITAGDGLGKLLQDPYFEGQLPTDGEIKLLRDIFGSDFAKLALDQRSTGTKIGQTISNVINIPRAFMAGLLDMSAPFRQGLILMAERPKEWTVAFGKMIRYFFDDRYFNAAMNNITTSPMAHLREAAGLEITEVTGKAVGLMKKEEGFMTNLAAKIPVIGIGVRASERAMTGFLNSLRASSFDAIAKEFMAGGLNPSKNPEVFTGLSKFLNTATGRAPLPKVVEGAVPFLNGVFFSPRLLYSRVQMFNPVWYFNLPQPVRKIAVKSFLKTVGVGVLIKSLAGLHPDAEIENDPRSSDFWKIKIGNARWDVFGGFQQWFVLGARLLTGESKAAASGKIRELAPNQFPYDTRLDVVLRFLMQKEAPIPGLITDLLRGQTSVGEELGVGQQMINKLVPLYIQDIIDVVKEDESIGLGIGIGVPGFFGIGTQYFLPSAPQNGHFGLPKLPELPKLPQLPKLPKLPSFPAFQ